MLLGVIRFPVWLTILTKMLRPLGQLGPSTSVTTYRLLLSCVYHPGPRAACDPLCDVRNVNADAPWRPSPCDRRHLVSRFAPDRGFAGKGWRSQRVASRAESNGRGNRGYGTVVHRLWRSANYRFQA